MTNDQGNPKNNADTVRKTSTEATKGADQDTVQKNADTFSGLPQPFRFFAHFIADNFPKMGPTVQVTVFLSFTALLILAGLKVIFPSVFEIISSNRYVEIRGVLTADSGKAISGEKWRTDLMGEGLFVYKEPTPPSSSKFKYNWILKVPSEAMNKKTRLALMEGGDEKVTYDFLPSELLKNEHDDEVQLEVDKDFTEMKLIGALTVSEDQRRNLASMWGIPFTPYGIQDKFMRIQPDSAKLLIRRYQMMQNPVAQTQIRESLVDGGVPTMVTIAESLRTSVLDNRRSDIASYASLLSGFDSLRTLTSEGRFASTFGGEFYAKAVEVLHKGDESASRSMASLLRNLQDVRSLEDVFHEYVHSPYIIGKKLCLVVLKGFGSNRSKEVTSYVGGWLEKTLRENTIEEMRQPLADALNTFRGTKK